MTNDVGAVERRIAEIAARITGETSDPGQPLPLDSLSHAEFIFELEDELGVRLPDQVSLRTIAEAAEAVGQALERRANGAPLREGIGHLQRLALAALRPTLSRYHRLSVEGAERVPREGPVLLACNHDSLLDIPFLAIACPRPVWFMAKRELFEKRFGAWAFHVLGGFPVDRGGNDLKALRAALATIERGRALAMYPEGTRDKEFRSFLPGAAWVALATGAPLVPVGVRGTGEAMPMGSLVPKRTRISVAFGEPFEPGVERDTQLRLERAAKLTVELRGAVERLLWR